MQINKFFVLASISSPQISQFRHICLSPPIHGIAFHKKPCSLTRLVRTGNLLKFWMPCEFPETRRRRFCHHFLATLLVLTFSTSGFAQENNVAPLKKGLQFFLQANYKQALVEFTESVGISPSDPKAYYYLGLTHSKLNQHKKALDSFTKTLKLDPAHEGAHLNLGIAHFKLKSFDGAVKQLNWILQKNAGHSVAHFFMGLALQRQKISRRQFHTLKKRGRWIPS